MYISCLFSGLLFGVALAFPWENAYNGPHRVVMMSGYYGTPVQGRNHQYVPQGSISAFVNRDTVATNTYAGAPLDIPGGELPLEEHSGGESYPDKTEVQEFSSHEAAEDAAEVSPGQPIPHVAIEDVDSSAANEGTTDAGTLATKAPKRVARKKKVPKPVVPQEDDEEEEEPQRKTYVPSNNVYFPITITGSGGARNRARNGAEQPEDEYYAPGSATAIANSYSTGRGGIATSHATSFGDPYLASMLYRNGFFNYNQAKAKKGQTEV